MMILQQVTSKIIVYQHQNVLTILENTNLFNNVRSGVRKQKLNDTLASDYRSERHQNSRCGNIDHNIGYGSSSRKIPIDRVHSSRFVSFQG